VSKWADTSTIFENDGTFSKNVIDFEKPKNTFDLEFDENTASEALEKDVTWEQLQQQNPDPPKIRVFDVAAYILKKKETMTTMKLQKLIYYSQAWSLVWDEKPLFEEKIEAWANGPVVRNLFDYHRGMYEISEMPIGNPRLLDQNQQETVDAVLEYYGHRSAQWLIDLSHMEDPWIHARKGLPALERGNRVIPLDVMADYYSSLPVEEDFEDGKQE
jgi:uncharacterized phage-associated protein